MKTTRLCCTILVTSLLAACGGGNQEAQPAQSPRLLASVVATSAADYTPVVQQLYVSYFGRPADTAGLNNFKNQLAALQAPTDIAGLSAAYSTNASLKALIDSFGNSRESQALYAGTNEQFISAIYRNLLSREPNEAGKAFWVGALDKGSLTRANASLSIMSGAFGNSSTQGQADAALIHNRVALATAFSDAMLTVSQVNSYSGSAAAAKARALLASISNGTNTASFAALASATLDSMSELPSGTTMPTLPPSASTATPEGFWSGTASNGAQVRLALLEDGSSWGVYLANNTIAGAIIGSVTVNGSTASGIASDFNVATRSVTTTRYTGTFTAKNTINITASNGITFAGKYNTAYDQAVSLATVAGTYSGSAITGQFSQAINVTVSATGAITSAGNGCSASGTATPRASGKNVFDIKVVFSGTNCALGNGTATSGVATYDAQSRSLLALAANGSKSDGFIFIGTR
ncbi:MAG: DUF4214 domain-containing protein [Pseudomonadota bacterium]